MFGSLFGKGQTGSAQVGTSSMSANERLSVRQELLTDVISLITRRAPRFKYIVFNVEYYKHFSPGVPTRLGKYGASCEMGEFVIVDANGDEICVPYADLGYKPRAETREYLAECVAEYFSAHIWKDERVLNEGTTWQHHGTAGCVVYTDESYPEWCAFRGNMHNVREC